ncbi:MAG: hypothetical protein KDA21_03660 [Phycisphaerales bacterium]|nr:hypothetical protein [Phycisphaerales bacterium]
MDEARDVETLLTWLEAHDERCPVCGYRLQGLTAPTCPECGGVLRLCVDVLHIRQRAWMLALLGPALGLGFTGVTGFMMSVAGLVEMLRNPAPLPYQPVVIAATMGTLVLVNSVLLWQVARARRRFLAGTTWERWRRALIVFGAVGIGHALVGLGLIAVL